MKANYLAEKGVRAQIFFLDEGCYFLYLKGTLDAANSWNCLGKTLLLRKYNFDYWFAYNIFVWKGLIYTSHFLLYICKTVFLFFLVNLTFIQLSISYSLYNKYSVILRNISRWKRNTMKKIRWKRFFKY